MVLTLLRGPSLCSPVVRCCEEVWPLQWPTVWLSTAWMSPAECGLAQHACHGCSMPCAVMVVVRGMWLRLLHIAARVWNAPMSQAAVVLACHVWCLFQCVTKAKCSIRLVQCMWLCVGLGIAKFLQLQQLALNTMATEVAAEIVLFCASAWHTCVGEWCCCQGPANCCELCQHTLLC